MPLRAAPLVAPAFSLRRRDLTGFPLPLCDSWERDLFFFFFQYGSQHPSARPNPPPLKGGYLEHFFPLSGWQFFSLFFSDIKGSVPPLPPPPPLSAPPRPVGSLAHPAPPSGERQVFFFSKSALSVADVKAASLRPLFPWFSRSILSSGGFTACFRRRPLLIKRRVRPFFSQAACLSFP